MIFEQRFSAEAREEAGELHRRINDTIARLVLEKRYNELFGADSEVGRLLEELKARKSERCYRDYRHHLDNLRQVVGGVLENHITQKDLLVYMGFLKAEGEK